MIELPKSCPKLSTTHMARPPDPTSQGTPSLRRSPAPQRRQEQRGQQPAAAALRLAQERRTGGQGQAQHGQPGEGGG